MYVGVLHIKPFFLPVDIQHNQCPCRFYNPRRYTSDVVTKLRQRDTTLPRTRYAVSTAVGNAMACHHIPGILLRYTIRTTYTFYELEKGKKTIKDETKKEDESRELKKKNETKNEEKI